MNCVKFQESLQEANPPAGLSVLMQALWYDGKGNWEYAHDLINDRQDTASAHVHAYLHRKEGDAGNARYWYHRAGQPVFTGSLDEEWKQLVERYLH
jgi:hypothetical protein